MADIHHSLTFARMNPITSGHEAVVNQTMASAKNNKGGHSIILSGSQDTKKNPLTPEQKLKYAKHSFPTANIKMADKSKPTILHHASDLHNQGVTHLTLHVGSDRVESMNNLLTRYNGQPGAHGNYKFKKITVVPVGSGRKDTGKGVSSASGTSMRAHAISNNRAEFHKMAPSSMSPAHKDEMMRDVRNNMGVKEGIFKRFGEWLLEVTATD